MNNKGLYTLGEIASVISGELLCGDGKAHINELLIDSRKASAGSDALFFAIRGERHDGHNYLRELSGKGIRSFIISDRDAIHLLERDANVICCKSSVQALQDLAAHHRTRFNVPVIAITGSNGKTVVKEWLFQLLSSVKTVIRSPKSYNSQVGVPLSVWKLNRNCDLGIFEAGISLPGEMERLQKIIQPGIGIFTNIGEAHSEGFGSLEEKVEEKMKLFSAVDALIYCSDHDLIHKAVPAGLHTFRWSARDRGADIFVERISRQDYGSRISIVCNGEAFEVDLPFSDRASLENALHCISACLCMGVDKEHLIHSLPAVEAVAMRLQMREGINRCTLINDTYNSDTGSLEVALDMLVRQNQHKKKTVVLSDILQTGKAENALYASVAQMLKTAGVHALIGVGRAICASKELFSLPEQRFYPATEELLADFGNLHFSDEAVLLKGARPFGFERIARLMEQRTHRTVMEIDLDALVHNLNFFKSRLHRETGIMAMVKAISYGSGSYEIASVLEYNRVACLAVAYADEGVELRKAGIRSSIMVMSPEEEGFNSMLKYKLEPEISCFSMLDAFTAYIEKIKWDASNSLPLHIKLDTGMHRLGFCSDDLPALAEKLCRCKPLKVRSVFSHLAASENAAHDDFTRLQIQRFEQMTAFLEKQLGCGFKRHILNTAGILRFPGAQFDMVRLGIGLYGIGHEALQPVSSLVTKVIQMRHIGKGETVGYGRMGLAERDMDIATIAIGYADGFSRTLGNGRGHVLVGGKPAAVVGNVCMDMCMLDVTGLEVNEGDEVIVFGPGRPLQEYAKELGTIPYEALTKVSSRVKRVYYRQ